MQNVNQQVLAQADIEANPLLLSLGAAEGDTLLITRPDPVDPGTVTPPNDVSPANGTTVAPPADTTPPADVPPVDPAPVDVPPPPAQEEVTLTEGQACTLPDGNPGVLKSEGSNAAGTLTLVCVPTGDSAQA